MTSVSSNCLSKPFRIMRMVAESSTISTFIGRASHYSKLLNSQTQLQREIAQFTAECSHKARHVRLMPDLVTRSGNNCRRGHREGIGCVRQDAARLSCNDV